MAKFEMSEVERLMGRGVLVQCKIRGWGGMSLLTAEELGLDPEDFDGLMRGKKYVFPQEYAEKFSRLQGRMRSSLVKWGKKVAFGHFLFFLHLPRFEEEWNKSLVEFEEFKTWLQENYDSYLQESRVRWEGHVEKYLNGSGGEIVEAILSKIPELDELMETFEADYEVMPFPKPETSIEELEKLKGELREEERVVVDAIIKKKAEDMDSELRVFLNEVVGGVNREIGAVLDKAIGKIARTGEIDRGTSRSLNAILKKLDDLLIYDGAEDLKNKMAEVKALLKPIEGEDRDNKTLGVKLQEAKEIVSGTLDEIIGMSGKRRLEVEN